MDAGSAPNAPDPYVTADAQGDANDRAARTNTSLNRADQVTPWGTLKWSQAPGTREFDQDGFNRALDSWREAEKLKLLTPGSGGAGTGAGGTGTGGNGSSPGEGGGGGGDSSSDAPGGGNAPGRMPPGTVPTDASGRAADGGTATTDPYGRPRRSDYWEEVPSDRWTSTIELNPEMQKLFDAQNATALEKQGILDMLTGQAKDTLGQPSIPLPEAGLGNLGRMPGANENQRQKIEDALYGRMTSRLDPKFEQEEQAMRSELMNRGLVEGSEAWKTQMDAFSRGKNDAYSAAMNDAISGSGTEMQRYFDMGMDRRGQALTEGMASFGQGLTLHEQQSKDRANILNEMAGLQSGNQMQMPGFGATPSGAQTQGAPIAQSIWQAFQGELGGHNADVAAANGTNAAAGGAVATIVAAMI